MAMQEIGRDTTFGTYRAAGWPSVDFDAFHREILPARLAEGATPLPAGAPVRVVAVRDLTLLVEAAER